MVNIKEKNKIVNGLLEKGAEFASQQHKLAFEGNVQSFESFMQTNKIDLNLKDSGGHTILHYAAARGHVKFITWLLGNVSFNLSIDEKDQNGRSVLLIVIENNSEQEDNLEIIKLFLEKDPSLINSQDNHHNTPLLVAAKRGKLKLAQRLLEYGADLKEQNYKGYNAFFMAAKNGHIAIMQWLLELNKYTLPNEKDIHGCTPLIVAAKNGQYEVVKWLLDKKVSIEPINQNGFNALLAACSGEHINIIQLLRQHGANFHIKDEHGYNLLFMSAATGWLEVLKLLVQENIFSIHDRHDGDGSYTVLLIAAYQGHLDIVKWLLENGAAITDKIATNETAFLLATENNKADIVEWLLKYNYNKYKPLEDRDMDGNTALHIASKKGHINLVKMLLSYGADKEQLNIKSQTSLDIAKSNNYQEIIDVLNDDLLINILRNNFSISIIDSQINTPLPKNHLQYPNWLPIHVTILESFFNPNSNKILKKLLAQPNLDITQPFPARGIQHHLEGHYPLSAIFFNANPIKNGSSSIINLADSLYDFLPIVNELEPYTKQKMLDYALLYAISYHHKKSGHNYEKHIAKLLQVGANSCLCLEESGERILDIAKEKGLLYLFPTHLKHQIQLKPSNNILKKSNQIKSKLASAHYIIEHELAVVSLARNKNSKESPQHVFIIIEQIINGQYIVDFCDFVLDVAKKGKAKVRHPKSFIGNINDSIIDKCQEKLMKIESLNDIIYQSWAIPVDACNKIFNAIRLDESKELAYAYFGYTSLFASASSKKGHNCYTWAREKTTGFWGYRY